MEWRKVSTQNPRHIKLVEPNAVIGDAILWSVIGTNLLTAITATNQRLACLGVGGALALLFSGDDAAAQNRHPLLFVA